MSRSIYAENEIMDKIATITESEENRFSDVPGWDGDILASSPASILIECSNKGHPVTETWMPLSQLRKSEDKQSIYASNWILEKKNLG
jgi:hypothetical protein